MTPYTESGKPTHTQFAHSKPKYHVNDYNEIEVVKRHSSTWN